MKNLLVLSPEKCTGCRLCELICSFSHEKEFNPLRSRIRIIKFEERGIDLPVVCMQCEEAPCIRACPVRAIVKDEETGAVLVDEKVCIGCKLCLIVCPFGAPSLDPFTRKIVNCDLCDGDPRCVKFCETRALDYIRADKMSYLRKRAGIEKIGEILNLFITKVLPSE